MQRADDPTAEPVPARSARSVEGRVSVALLAAIACMPIVIAVGFLVDRPAGPSTGDAAASAAPPSDISVLALRGGLDAAAERRPGLPRRAGY